MIRVFLDMDDVLVNFTGHVVKHYFGLVYRDVMQHWKPGKFSIVDTIKEIPYAKEDGLADRADRLWVDWREWHELPLTPWASQLLNIGRVLSGDEPYVITSPPVFHDHSILCDCYAGKLLGYQKLIADGTEIKNDRLILTKHKPLFAKNRDCILIDDRQDTVNEWNKAGGTGILFPRWHNDHWQYSKNPMGVVLNDLWMYLREYICDSGLSPIEVNKLGRMLNFITSEQDNILTDPIDYPYESGRINARKN